MKSDVQLCPNYFSIMMRIISQIQLIFDLLVRT